jgi:uncharacterized Zn finger protein (UPF0148 family)
MTNDLYQIQDLNCPVCGKVLTSDEYNHAIEEISLKVREDYQEQIKRERSEFEEQIQNDRKLFQEKTDSINTNHNEHLQVLKDQLAASYNQQFQECGVN